MIDIGWVLGELPKMHASWTMPDFLKAHTLHDGDFLGALVREDGGAVLWIRLDLVWNRDVPDQHALAVFVFRTAYAVGWKGGCFRMATISDAEAAVLDVRQKEALLEDRSLDFCGPDHPSFDEGLTRTRIACVNSCEPEILHGSDVMAACVGPLGQIRTMPL